MTEWLKDWLLEPKNDLHMIEKIVIVIPQYNDSVALNLLIECINKDVSPDILANTTLAIVDDCSTEAIEIRASFKGRGIKIIRLYRNVGHQRAIALGLSYVAKEFECDKTIVMDADGEDAPKDINMLVKASILQPDKIIFAQRSSRQESSLFKVFYEVYKFIFKQLTGKIITFGNFSIIPRRRLQNLVRVSEIWNNYPGGVIKSRLAYTSIPLQRGKRLAGNSKMNFVSLVLHGLSAISVSIDVVAVRILILSIGLSFLTFVGLAVIVYFKTITDLAVPGWASQLGSAFLLMILQLFLISLFLVFTVLQYRTQQQYIPVKFYKDFIESVEDVSSC